MSKGFFWHDDAEEEFEEELRQSSGALLAQVEFAIRQLCQDSQSGPRRGPTCGRVESAFMDVQLGAYALYFAEAQRKGIPFIVGLHFTYSKSGSHSQGNCDLAKRRLARTRL